MQDFYQQIAQTIGAYVPNLLGALTILIVGWIVALIISATFRSILRKSAAGKKLSSWLSVDGVTAVPIDKYLSKTIFYIIMLFVLVAFFQTLRLTIITEPLNNLLNQLFTYSPRFFGAAILLGTAWVLATVLRLIVAKFLTTIQFDERLSRATDDESKIEISQTIATAVFWLIFLIFFPAILNSLGMQGLLEPVQSMLDKMLLFLPNVFSSGLILFFGWFLANIMRKIVSNLLNVAGINSLSERVGLGSVLGKEKLSDLVGLIVYTITLIPVLLIAMDALQLEAITIPVSNMLNVILTSLPGIFSALIIIFVAYIIGRLISKLVSNLLSGMGFDKFVVNLGVMQESKEEGRTASDVAGYLTLFAILFFAIIGVLELLGFTLVSEMAAKFTIFAGNVALGLVIFGFGLFFSNLVSGKILTKKTAQLKLFSLIARVTILFIAGAMALQQMGISGDIVNIAFGMTLGAFAVAVAVAFGIGGRDIASKYIQQWAKNLEDEK